MGSDSPRGGGGRGEGIRRWAAGGGEGARRGAMSVRGGGSATDIICVLMCGATGVGEINGAGAGGAMKDAADVGRVSSEFTNSGGDGEDCS